MFLGIVNCYLFEQMGNFTFFPTQRISHRKSIPQNICTHLRDIRFLLIMYVTFVKQKWQFQEEGWTLSTGIRTILNCWLVKEKWQIHLFFNPENEPYHWNTNHFELWCFESVYRFTVSTISLISSYHWKDFFRSLKCHSIIIRLYCINVTLVLLKDNLIKKCNAGQLYLLISEYFWMLGCDWFMATSIFQNAF